MLTHKHTTPSPLPEKNVFVSNVGLVANRAGARRHVPNFHKNIPYLHHLYGHVSLFLFSRARQ